VDDAEANKAAVFTPADPQGPNPYPVVLLADAGEVTTCLSQGRLLVDIKTFGPAPAVVTVNGVRVFDGTQPLGRPYAGKRRRPLPEP
jgi:predicted alpha/beta superfamily hydrolase